MTLIHTEPSGKKTALKLNIEEDLLQQVAAYCAFAGIENFDFFFKKAAQYILAHDPAWQLKKQHLSILPDATG